MQLKCVEEGVDEGMPASTFYFAPFRLQVNLADTLAKPMTEQRAPRIGGSH